MTAPSPSTPPRASYRGEQSFLDWREQTYPAWTVPDLARIGESEALSTNVTHLVALETGARLSEERGDAATATAFRDMATALRGAIRQKLWLADAGGLATFLPTTLDAAPVRRFDLLGTSLAILEGVLPEADARAALSKYPTFEAGPAVVHPAEPGVPIYHNRGIWPFVTAYWAKAGRKVGHDGVVTAAVRSLVRGAALNLSNMENLENTTGKAHLDEGATSGPVVNSQRQLWSVAGYVGVVNGVLFGVEPTADGLVVQPAITKALRRAELAAAKTIALDNLPYRGKRVTVVVRLPEATNGEGTYAVARVRLNGKTKDGGRMREDELAARNLVEVDLAEPAGPALAVTTLDASARRTWEAPRLPRVTGVSVSGGRLVVGLDRGGEAPGDVTFSVYRDGVRVATNVAGSETSWTDATTAGAGSPSHCYTVDTTFVAGGTTSHRAAPACFWGAANERITTIGAASFAATGGSPVTEYGHFHYQGWGDAGHRITATFTAARGGAHPVQAVYGNGAGGLTTGITCAVKRVDVEDVATGARVGGGYLVMPHRGGWDSWGESSFVKATLVAGKAYRVVLSTDDRAVNMSAFSHFADYTAGTGGRGGLRPRERRGDPLRWPWELSSRARGALPCPAMVRFPPRSGTRTTSGAYARGRRRQKPRTLVWEELVLSAKSLAWRALAAAAEDGLGDDAFDFVDLRSARAIHAAEARCGGGARALGELTGACGRAGYVTGARRALRVARRRGPPLENAVPAATRGRLVFSPLDVEMIWTTSTARRRSCPTPIGDRRRAGTPRGAQGPAFLGKPVDGATLVAARAYHATLFACPRGTPRRSRGDRGRGGRAEAPIRAPAQPAEYVLAGAGGRAAVAPFLPRGADGPGRRALLLPAARAPGAPLVRDPSLTEVRTLPAGDVPARAASRSRPASARSLERRETLVVQGSSRCSARSITAGSTARTSVGAHRALRAARDRRHAAGRRGARGPRDLGDYVASVYLPCRRGRRARARGHAGLRRRRGRARAVTPAGAVVRGPPCSSLLRRLPPHRALRVRPIVSYPTVGVVILQHPRSKSPARLGPDRRRACRRRSRRGALWKNPRTRSTSPTSIRRSGRSSPSRGRAGVRTAAAATSPVVLEGSSCSTAPGRRRRRSGGGTRGSVS